MSELENKEFGDLCEMAGRFSDDEEELKIPNMFFSEESILNKAKYVTINFISNFRLSA